MKTFKINRDLLNQLVNGRLNIRKKRLQWLVIHAKLKIH